jgi:hypothetical protein
MAHAFSVWLLLLLPTVGVQGFETSYILQCFMSMQNITLFLTSKYGVNMYAVYSCSIHTLFRPCAVQCNILFTGDSK